MHHLAPVLLLAVALLAACSDDEPELTFEERLEQIEGELTAEQLAEREQLASLLCNADPAVLVDVWARSDGKQLEFHDLVVAQVCPEHYELYAESTGRFEVADDED